MKITGRYDNSYSSYRAFSHVRSAIFFTMEVVEYRVLIKHCFLMGKTALETTEFIQKCYPGSAPSISSVRRWIHKFKRGDFSVQDGDRTGRPNSAVTTENINKALKLVRSDRRLKLDEMAKILRISHGSVFTILHDHLGMRKLCARWVPRLLTPDQKQQRVDDSKRCLEIFRHNKKDFLRCYITMDETWIHHFNPESRIQAAEWTGPGESRPKRPKTQTSAGKVMASVFWDTKGIIMVDYLAKGKTINSEYYIKLLVRLKQEIAIKRPHMQKKKIVFHQDNAPIHKSAATMAKLAELHFELLHHPPYSPDLAPSDYFLFSELKKSLRGIRYGSDSEVIDAANEYFEGKDKTFYKGGIEKLEARWQKCIDLCGDYIEE